MKVSYEELQNRIKWTLQQKIDHSLFTIENALTYCNNNAYVSYSGGKDSTVLLYLVRLIKPDIRAVFFNTTNEYPEMYRFLKTQKNIEWVQPEMNLKQVIEKYGFPLISKEQAQYIREARTTKSEKLLQLRLNSHKKGIGQISKKWQHLLDAPFDISEKCCFYLKKKPAHKFEKETGLMAIIGTRATESRLRLKKYQNTGCNSFDTKRKASYPLSIWTAENIDEFIKKNNIEICSLYSQGLDRTGCMICGFGCAKDTERFENLKKIEPVAYEQMMNIKNNGISFIDALQTVLQKQKKSGGKNF